MRGANTIVHSVFGCRMQDGELNCVFSNQALLSACSLAVSSGSACAQRRRQHCVWLQVKEQYLACLKEHANEAEGCRDLAKAYLECRMERCAR